MAARARKVNVALALAACLTLAGCAGLDVEELRACRLVAATLGPPGTRIEILSQSGRRLDDGLDLARVDVLLHAPDRRPRRDFVVCRFRRQGAGAPNLVAVSTERGPMAGAAMHLLRRFRLDDPDSGLEDPAPFGLDAAPEAPRWLALTLQHAANALPGGAVAALLAGA